MREPQSPEQRWSWWENAVAALAADEEARPAVYEDQPQQGFYAVRKFRYAAWPRGPYLPARIWWEPGDIDPETGELMSDERCRAEIDGKEVNPWNTWTSLARRPISEEEFRFLTAMSPLLPQRPPRKPRG